MIRSCTKALKYTNILQSPTRELPFSDAAAPSLTPQVPMGKPTPIAGLNPYTSRWTIKAKVRICFILSDFIFYTFDQYICDFTPACVFKLTHICFYVVDVL